MDITLNEKQLIKKKKKNFVKTKINIFVFCDEKTWRSIFQKA